MTIKTIARISTVTRARTRVHVNIGTDCPDCPAGGFERLASTLRAGWAGRGRDQAPGPLHLDKPRPRFARHGNKSLCLQTLARFTCGGWCPIEGGNRPGHYGFRLGCRGWHFEVGRASYTQTLATKQKITATRRAA